MSDGIILVTDPRSAKYNSVAHFFLPSSNDLVECSAGGGQTDEILERGYLNVYIDYKRYPKQLDKMFNHCPELKEFK